MGAFRRATRDGGRGARRDLGTCNGSFPNCGGKGIRFVPEFCRFRGSGKGSFLHFRWRAPADFQKSLTGTCFLTEVTVFEAAEQQQGTASGMLVGGFRVDLRFDGLGEVGFGGADGPVLTCAGESYGLDEAALGGVGGAVLGDHAGEEAQAVGFAGFVGLDVFSVKAVFAAVGGGFAAAFGGFWALGFATVGPGGEDLSGGWHVSFGGYSFPWEDRRTGLCRKISGFELSALFSGERFLKIIVTDYRPIWRSE